MFEAQRFQSAPEVGILRPISSASTNGRFRVFDAPFTYLVSLFYSRLQNNADFKILLQSLLNETVKKMITKVSRNARQTAVF